MGNGKYIILIDGQCGGVHLSVRRATTELVALGAIKKAG